MNDIFLSYDSSDRALAQKFTHTLEALGWSVWWDREIPHGADFDFVIERELNAARCAIVLWSRESVQSRWVRSEASAAAARGCLIPVLIEPVDPPLEFRQMQAAMLVGWDGDTDEPEFVRLVASLTRMIGRGPADTPPAPPTIASTTSKPARKGLAVGVVALAIIAFVAWLWFRDGSVSAPKPPADGAMTIAVGGTIEEGSPGLGAGVIERPHEKDVYTFTVEPGQRVFFRVLDFTAPLAPIEWKLIDENETEIFATCLGCTQPGVHALRTGGPYTLVVGSDLNEGVGSYRLRLHPVPAPDRFEIVIGDSISEATGPGAGTIESPGAEDVYVFDAMPRQRVYVRTVEFSPGLAQARVRLLDADEQAIFDTCLGCADPGVQTLTRGPFTLTVGNSRDPATGSYRMQLFDVPAPDEFAIDTTSRISNGVPERGAGLIESPGAEDRYTFVVEAGQRVEIKVLHYDKALSQSLLRLVADDGTELFNRCLGCSPRELHTFASGGRYHLIVGNPREPSTGAYSIELAPP